MTLQQQVQQYLQNTGISLRELARRSGISHQAIGKILRGGTYKSDTAHALYSLISITPISTYKTLDATIEQLAAQRVNADLTHHAEWDVDLQCAKYRRVMQLEKQLEQTQDVLKQREQHLKSCENALIEANEKITKQDAWIDNQAAARNQLQLSLRESLDNRDDLQSRFDSLQAAYNQQVDDEREMLAQIDTLFVERENAKTKHEQQVMRLRVRCFALVCAIVFLIVSGLVVWGGV